MVKQAFWISGIDEHPVTSAVTGVPLDSLVERAKVELKTRQHRRRHFPSSFFGEPVWDMLIALYLSQERRETVCNLIYGCDLPHTTGLRWLEVLDNHDLIRRKPHHKDKRVTLVELTEGGQYALESYFLTIPRINI